MPSLGDRSGIFASAARSTRLQDRRRDWRTTRNQPLFYANRIHRSVCAIIIATHGEATANAQVKDASTGRFSPRSDVVIANAGLTDGDGPPIEWGLRDFSTPVYLRMGLREDRSRAAKVYE
jgi:hypothetical protein